MEQTTGQEITGQTPNGAGFTLKKYSLHWHPFDGVGFISVPLDARAPLQEIADEITRNGAVSEETRRAWFNC